MKKILLLLFVTALFQLNAQDLSQLKNNLNQKSFKGQPIETDLLAINAKRDSISILNQPQAMTVIMTDAAEVRLDSTFILSPSLDYKTKTIYNEEDRVTRTLSYTNLANNTYSDLTFFSASGIDSEGVTIVVSNNDINIPDGYEIVSSKISDFSMTSSDVDQDGIADSMCYYYYEAVLDITGGDQNGLSTQGCGTDFNNLDVTGFSSIEVTSIDTDNFDDSVLISFNLDIELRPSTEDDETFNLLASESNYEYDANGNTTLEENIYYDPYSGSEITSINRTEFSFNDNSNILTIKQYFTYPEQPSLTYLFLDQERLYDEDGYYIEGQQFYYNPDGSIIVGSKYEFTRDNDGLWYYRTVYDWDIGSGIFLVTQEDEKAKFENFNTNITLNFNGSSSLGTSSPQSKVIFSRDGFNSVSTNYNWSAYKEAYIPSNKSYANRTYFDDGESLETSENATSYWNAETDSFVYNNYSSKYNRTYDTEQRQIYYNRSTYSVDSQEFITSDINESQYDENGNRIFYKSTNYEDFNFYYVLPTIGAWISSQQINNLFDENGFISQRMYSSGSYETSESEYVTAYFKDDYSTILDSETNFIRMGAPSLSDDGTNWENIQGPSFKSYYWYTQNSSLSTEDDSGSRIGLYPNPTNSVLLLNSNVPHKIEVYDLGGRKIIESIGVEIDISSLSNATYVVKIIDLQSNEFVSKKIIKE